MVNLAKRELIVAPVNENLGYMNVILSKGKKAGTKSIQVAYLRLLAKEITSFGPQTNEYVVHHRMLFLTDKKTKLSGGSRALISTEVDLNSINPLLTMAFPGLKENATEEEKANYVKEKVDFEAKVLKIKEEIVSKDTIWARRKPQQHSINHYRRLKSVFSKDGTKGVIHYISELQKNSLVGLSYKAANSELTEEERNSVKWVNDYYDLLKNCVLNSLLIIRKYAPATDSINV